MENYPTDFVGKETLEAIHAADKFIRKFIITETNNKTKRRFGLIERR